jgi:tRNA nucleotidyltransferase/poly(A) polymerase
MTMNHQKHEILKSLGSLDASQAEKVLTYINALITGTPNQNELRYLKFKREAMKEISQALRGRQLNSTF